MSNDIAIWTTPGSSRASTRSPRSPPSARSGSSTWWERPKSGAEFDRYDLPIRRRKPSCRSMIFSEKRCPPRIKSGAGFFGIMLQLASHRLDWTLAIDRHPLGVFLHRFDAELLVERTHGRHVVGV